MVESRRPAGPLTGLAAVTTFRPDGRRLATTGLNGDLKVWDTDRPRQPRLLVRLKGRRRVIAAAWNPTAADLLATLSTDGNISIWRLLDDRPPEHLVVLPQPFGRTGLLTWFPDGRHVACAGNDGVVSVWDAETGQGQAQTLGNSSICLALFASTGNMLRAVYRDGSVRVASPLRRRAVPPTEYLRPVVAAAWSASGQALVIARPDGSVEGLDRSLQVRWAREVTQAGPLLLGWDGEAVAVVADRGAKYLGALDAAGTPLWRTRLTTTPTSLSAAGGVVAIGGCGYAPRLVELSGGVTLSGN